jgi:type III pantothenate kinase
VDEQGKLIGGAILPGLRSQLLTLKHKTAALPEIELPDRLPLRWALDTDTAIASGILYTTISGIYSYILDWLKQFPDSQIIFTGGDGELLLRLLHQQFPELSPKAIIEPHLVFQGIKLVYAQKNPHSTMNSEQ